MASKECSARGMEGAVSAGGALDPDKIAAGVGDEEERLGRGAQTEIGEVLAGAE